MPDSNKKQEVPAKRYLIDEAHTPWDQPQMVELKTILSKAYGQLTRAQTIAQTAGIDISHLNLSQAIAFLWKELIELAMAQAKLRTLLEKAIEDRQISGFRSQLEPFLNYELPPKQNQTPTTQVPTSPALPAQSLLATPTPAPATSQTPPSPSAVPVQPSTPNPPPVAPTQSSTPEPAQARAGDGKPSPKHPSRKRSTPSSRSFIRWMLLALVIGTVLTGAYEYCRPKEASQTLPQTSLEIRDKTGTVKKTPEFEQSLINLDRSDIPEGTKLCLLINGKPDAIVDVLWSSPQLAASALKVDGEWCCEPSLERPPGHVRLDIKSKIRYQSWHPFLQLNPRTLDRSILISPAKAVPSAGEK